MAKASQEIQFTYHVTYIEYCFSGCAAQSAFRCSRRNLGESDLVWIFGIRLSHGDIRVLGRVRWVLNRRGRGFRGCAEKIRQHSNSLKVRCHSVLNGSRSEDFEVKKAGPRPA